MTPCTHIKVATMGLPRLLKGLALGSVTLGLLVGFVFFTGPINEENLAKIKRGMTVAQVEAILGIPTETEDERPGAVFLAMDAMHLNGQYLDHADENARSRYRIIGRRTWEGNSTTIQITFVEKSPVDSEDWKPSKAALSDGIVACASSFPRETLLNRIRGWVGFN